MAIGISTNASCSRIYRGTVTRRSFETSPRLFLGHERVSLLAAGAGRRRGRPTSGELTTRLYFCRVVGCATGGLVVGEAVATPGGNADPGEREGAKPPRDSVYRSDDDSGRLPSLGDFSEEMGRNRNGPRVCTKPGYRPGRPTGRSGRYDDSIISMQKTRFPPFHFLIARYGRCRHTVSEFLGWMRCAP